MNGQRIMNADGLEKGAWVEKTYIDFLGKPVGKTTNVGHLIVWHRNRL